MNEQTLIYGIHAVKAALQQDATAVTEVLLVPLRNNRRLDSIRDTAAQAGVKLRQVSANELDALCDDARHQGVVARVLATQQPATLELLLQTIEQPLLLVLDGVQDPHNLGACLRTADAAGVHAVIVPQDRAVGLTPVVHKVACGAAETMPFYQVTNLARTLRMLQEQGVWLIGADEGGDKALFAADLKGPLALVMGAEGKGLRRLTRELCDVMISIPMAGQVSSLNVSVATGVCLFEIVRQRRGVSVRGEG
jgi:23S rRNA (guanosine2251-2'-O)-methyltransferase